MAGPPNFKNFAEIFFGDSSQFESNFVNFFSKSKFGLVRYDMSNKWACRLHLYFNN